MVTSTINEQIILSVFTADDRAKVRALDILQGKEIKQALCGPLLLGMGEAAELLGVSRATLWRMIRNGRLTKVEVYHNSYRLRMSDIYDLVEGKESPPPSDTEPE